jgi:hypothetical protein
MKILMDSIGTINTDPNALSRIMDVIYRTSMDKAAAFSRQVMEAQEQDRMSFGNNSLNYQYLLPQMSAEIIPGGKDDPQALLKALQNRTAPPPATTQQGGRPKVDLTKGWTAP